MHSPNLPRRDATRLTLAALGGLLTGTLVGCREQATSSPKAGTPAAPGKGAGETANRMLEEPHVCRGLNTCKNKGKSGTNVCAGQGTCATVASHDCNGMNDCKGQGGCGETPGQNECKGKGACAVPLSDKTWPKARKRFEELMAKAGKKVGDAPANKN